MNQFFDILLLTGFKFIIIISFIYLIKYWVNKRNNILQIISYWSLGLFFVFMMTLNISELLLNFLLYDKNGFLTDKNSLQVLSVFIGLLLYITIGVKYFKKRKRKKRKLFI